MNAPLLFLLGKGKWSYRVRYNLIVGLSIWAETEELMTEKNSR
jgi:hypothetical protein